MLQRSLFLLSLLVLGLSCSTQPVETATIVVQDEVLNTIDPRLFGQFLERPSWGGEYQETGPEVAFDPATGTLHQPVIDLMEEMEIPVIRWPGGSDVDFMDWTDMIDNAPGRAEAPRPASTGRSGQVVTNRFGMDEALNLTEDLGAEMILVLNIGDALQGRRSIEETAMHAAGLIAYATAEVGAELPAGMPDWPAVRAQNGRTEPWNVRYAQIGNEVWLIRDENGDPFLPNRAPIADSVQAYYFETLHAMIDAVKAVDPDIEIIVEGQISAVTPLLRDEFGDDIDYLALHQYHPWGMQQIFHEADTLDGLTFAGDPANHEALWLAWSAPRNVTDAGTAVLRNDDFEEIVATGYPIAMTEWNWNGWWNNWETAPVPPYDPFSARGLGAASLLHEMLREGSAFALATQSMLVGRHWQINGIRFEDPDTIYRHPSAMVTTLYSMHHGNEQLAISHDELETYDQPYRMSGIRPQEDIAYLDPVVTRRGDTVYLHLISRRFDGDAASLVRLDLSALGEIDQAEHHILYTRTHPEHPGGDVHPREDAWFDTLALEAEGTMLEAMIPPHSVSVVAVTLQNSSSP